MHVLDPYHGPQRGRVDDAETGARATSRRRSSSRGPRTIAAFILETVTGTNGILIPPDGYLQGVRELCDKYGILMVADEIMCGFGRTGEWFAVDHWGVVPDIITMRQGPDVLVRAARRGRHAAARSPTTSTTTCSAAASRTTRTRVGWRRRSRTIGVYEEDELIEQREDGRGACARPPPS